MSDVSSEETKGKTFKDVKGLSPWVVQQLLSLKIVSPTPIQYHCIPEVLKGRDVIGAAKTGSGKTMAFVLPILQNLSKEPHRKYSLILTPTRELAEQIGDQVREIGRPLGIRVIVIVGGFNIVEQKLRLTQNNGPHIIVSTPGRLVDILRYSSDISLKKSVKILVLDEVDRLCDEKFEEDLNFIIEQLPVKRQTLLFSATITDSVIRLKKITNEDRFIWQSSGQQATVEQLDERFCLLNVIEKDPALVVELKKFREEQPDNCVIVFTKTCKNAQVLSMMLNRLNVKAACLHSMMKQIDRLKTLRSFKNGSTKILVATDLASRGLDIPMVALVINHCIPETYQTYIHRVGRTARVGKPGKAITFTVPPYELKTLIAIESSINRKLAEYKTDDTKVKKCMKEVNFTVSQQQIKLEQNNFDESRNINKRKNLILDGKDPDKIMKKKRKKESNKKSLNSES